jgi:hypothetical protein
VKKGYFDEQTWYDFLGSLRHRELKCTREDVKGLVIFLSMIAAAIVIAELMSISGSSSSSTRPKSWSEPVRSKSLLQNTAAFSGEE